MRFLQRHILFIVYIACIIGISLIAHRDLLSNSYNYGRHWDWTFFSYGSMYERYIQNFYFVINNNASGTYGTIGFSDFTVKLLLLTVGRLLPFVALPILNKTFVFVVLPLIASIGIWFLTMAVGRSIRSRHHSVWWIALFGSICYTFSLPFLYELHGGALNRMVSISVLPYILALLTALISSQRASSFIILISLLSIFLDVANIFYVSVAVVISIMLRENSFRQKMSQLVLYGGSLILVNAYWLYAIIISRTINPIELSTLRKTTFEVLRNYSVPFKQLLLATSTPHNLIEIAYHDYWIRHLPSVVSYLLLFASVWLVYRKKTSAASRILIITLVLYLFTTLLTSGTYSIGNVYYGLYQIPFLGFIQNSVRFTTNAILSLYLLLITFLMASGLGAKKSINVFLGAVSTLWIGFLIINPGIMKMTYEQSIQHTPKNIRRVNNEIGSLYEPESAMSQFLEHDRSLGNILPVPSSISPYFEHNLYPRTSQGSHTEVEFEKAVLQTTGSAASFDSYFRSLMRKKEYHTLLQDYSVEYLWLPGTSVPMEKEHYFDHFNIDMLRDMQTRFLPQSLETLAIDSEQSVIVIPNNLRTPIVAVRSNGGDDIGMELKKINDTLYLGVIHNAPNFFTVELKKLYYAGWELQFVEPQVLQPVQHSLLSNYRILPNNERTQANLDELKKMIAQNRISTIGSGELRWLQYHEFDDGIERNGRRVPYVIDYISKPIRGVIQNQNLSDFSTAPLSRMTIPSQYHRTIYSYANAWDVKKSDVCARIRCSSDDTLYFVLSFSPQKEYQNAVFISATAFVILLGSSIYLLRSKHYEN